MSSTKRICLTDAADISTLIIILKDYGRFQDAQRV